MNNSSQCDKLNSVAYKSCLYSYFRSKDKEDIFDYWLQMIGANRLCEAKGAEKALELINLSEDINGKN